MFKFTKQSILVMWKGSFANQYKMLALVKCCGVYCPLSTFSSSWFLFWNDLNHCSVFVLPQRAISKQSYILQMAKSLRCEGCLGFALFFFLWFAFSLGFFGWLGFSAEHSCIHIHALTGCHSNWSPLNRAIIPIYFVSLPFYDSILIRIDEYFLVSGFISRASGIYSRAPQASTIK